MPDNHPLRITMHGATGRMGRRVCDLVLQDSSLRLVGAVAAPNDPLLHQDIGLTSGLGACGVLVGASIPDQTEVVIDFSTPEACLTAANVCRKSKVPMVAASTGFTSEQRTTLESAGVDIPILIAANCSLVVNVLMRLTETAGRLLANRDFDVEIVERHHRFKADAPSGTALAFARILQQAMGLETQRHGREGIIGVRPSNEIGMHAVRAGDNVGEHTIIFSTLGETMELVHKGSSRDSYAKGAIAAAKFLAGKPPGLYTMGDVLGI